MKTQKTMSLELETWTELNELAATLSKEPAEIMETAIKNFNRQTQQTIVTCNCGCAFPVPKFVSCPECAKNKVEAE